MRNKRAYLSEATRGDLLRRSRYQSKARWQKRLNYTISDFRGVDLKELFDNDTFVYNTPIKDYICTVSFDKALTAIKKYVKNTNSVKDITLNMIAKALLWAYNDSDRVLVNCSCPDYWYRFHYHASQGGYQYGEKETRPANITNPRNNKGAVCKHLDLLLGNESWLGKSASVITQFIKAFPEKASYYLYDDKKKIPFDDYDKPDEEPTDTEETDDTLELNVPEEEPIETENSEEENG